MKKNVKNSIILFIIVGVIVLSIIIGTVAYMIAQREKTRCLKIGDLVNVVEETNELPAENSSDKINDEISDEDISNINSSIMIVMVIR